MSWSVFWFIVWVLGIWWIGSFPAAYLASRVVRPRMQPDSRGLEQVFVPFWPIGVLVLVVGYLPLWLYRKGMEQAALAESRGRLTK